MLGFIAPAIRESLRAYTVVVSSCEGVVSIA